MPNLSDYHTLLATRWWKTDPPGWPVLSKLYARVYSYSRWKSPFRDLPRRGCGFEPKLMECVILEKNRIEFLVSFTCGIADRTLSQEKKKSRTVLAPTVWIPQQTKGHLFRTYLFISLSPWRFFSQFPRTPVSTCPPGFAANLKDRL